MAQYLIALCHFFHTIYLQGQLVYHSLINPQKEQPHFLCSFWGLFTIITTLLLGQFVYYYPNFSKVGAEMNHFLSKVGAATSGFSLLFDKWRTYLCVAMA